MKMHEPLQIAASPAPASQVDLNDLGSELHVIDRMAASLAGFMAADMNSSVRIGSADDRGNAN